MTENKKIPLTGLWKNSTKNGMEYFSGNLNAQTKLLIFPNSFKKTDTQPDFVVYLAPIEKEQTTDARPPQTTRVSAPSMRQMPKVSTLTDEDVPF